MEVNINRKFIIIATAIIALFAGVAIALWPSAAFVIPTGNGSLGTRTVSMSPTGSQSVRAVEPEAAAVAFVNAFYAVNYEDYDGWLAALKSVSTDEGYAILTKSVVPAVWPEIENARTVTPSSAIRVEDAGLVLNGDSQIGGLWQIRNVAIHIDSDHLWPTMKTGEFTALIMLAKQNEQWRFVSFMTPDQIDQIEKGPQE